MYIQAEVGMPTSPLELFDILFLNGPEAELIPFAMVPVKESSRAILASKERIRQASKNSPIVGVAILDPEKRTVSVEARKPCQAYTLLIFDVDDVLFRA